MNRFSTVAIAVLSLLLLAGELPVGRALSQEQVQDASDVDRVSAASQVFIAATAARDIRAMDKVWAHEPYATFIGPLSTTVVVGWDGVRKAWEMRFGQFDRVTISMDKPHIRINGQAAWAVGMERVELLRKGRQDHQLRCLRDQRFREQRRAVAFGGAPGDAGLQAA
jgi:ketosteroid isomerase-like protein